MRRKLKYRGWFSIHDKYSSLQNRFKKALPQQKEVKNSFAYRLLGKTLFKEELWSFHKEPVARGLALGMFVAFTPTVGIQMIITCVLLLIFPGNLPVAIAACWVTNPFTVAPIYYAEYLLGQWIMEALGVASVQSMDLAKVSAMENVYDVAGAMWLGAIFVAIAAGALSYWGVHWLVVLEKAVRLDKLLHFRRNRLKKRNKGQKP